MLYLFHHSGYLSNQANESNYNKKLFTQACVVLHPCYSFNFMHFTQSLYNIHWKVEQLPKSSTLCNSDRIQL